MIVKSAILRGIIGKNHPVAHLCLSLIWRRPISLLSPNPGLTWPNSAPLVAISPTIIRSYSKGKDKGGSKKGKHKVSINEAELSEVIDVEELKSQMNNVIEKLKDDYMQKFSIRSSAGSIEQFKITFEDEVYPIHEVAHVIRKTPQLLIINCSAIPQVTEIILKSLRTSGMNLNPQQEGSSIIVPIPRVTKDHRENLAKGAKTLLNKYKDNLRNIQNKFVKEVQGVTEHHSKDLLFNVQQQIMAMEKQYVADAEKLCEHKQQELLESTK